MYSAEKKNCSFANPLAFGKTLYWAKFWSCTSYYTCGLWLWLQSTVGLAMHYSKETQNHTLVDKSLVGDFFGGPIWKGRCWVSNVPSRALWYYSGLMSWGPESRRVNAAVSLRSNPQMLYTLLCFTLDAHYMPQSFSQWQNQSASLWLILNFQANWTYWRKRSHGELSSCLSERINFCTNFSIV